MKKRTIKFWTKEEDKLLKKSLRVYPNKNIAAVELSKIMTDRTEGAINFRLYTLHNKNKRVLKGVLESPSKSVKLPQGSKIEFVGVNVTIDNKRITVWR